MQYTHDSHAGAYIGEYKLKQRILYLKVTHILT